MKKAKDYYKKASELLGTNSTDQSSHNDFSADGSKNIPARKIVFSLSGGGSLGSIQVGILAALFEFNLLPDVIIGTSVGALNGSWIATHPTLKGIERLKELWSSLKTSTIFTSSRMRALARIIIGRNYIFTDNGLRNLIIDNLGEVNFEDLALPLYIAATDLDTGQLEVFNNGPIVPAVLASSAIPGVFPPVAINGHLYVDGGIISHCALDVASNSGATHIVLIECPHPMSGNGYGILNPISKSFRLMLNRACQLEKDLFISTHSAPLMSLEPPFELDDLNPIDFSMTKELIEKAHQWAKEYLKDHASAFLASNVATTPPPSAAQT